MVFCNDVDLLNIEPSICKDAAFASQLQLSGSGDLAGTTFTLSSGSLNAANVAAGQVIVLSGGPDGCFPIVSVDSDTQLTLSVMYDGLFPDTGPGVASPIATATGLGFAIRSFWPQRKVVSDLLTRAAGIGPETNTPAGATILNPLAMRPACVLGTMQMIYNALAAVAAQPASLSLRADLYERRFRRALERARVEIDLDGDGKADVAKTLNVLEFRRT
jgi:hypothetical protein